MIRPTYFRLCLAAAAAILLASSLAATPARAIITEQDLKARIERATEGFKDLTVVGTAVYKNKKAISKIDPAYAGLYEFKSAKLAVKPPDKMRMDAKLGMVRVEYIVNNGTKILRVPKIGVNQVKDYSNDPAKLQDALDIGLITPGLWRNRRVEVIDDPQAKEKGEIKVRLHWPKGSMIYLAWIDAKDLWLKCFEKRDAQNKLRVRIVYSDPKKIGGVIWMPLTAEMYAGDGTKVGVSEFTNIEVNTGLPDSLFK